MLRKFALVLAVTSLFAGAATAQRADPIGQVTTHLRAVQSMTADFTQTDRKGQVLTGTLTLKRPGKVRFQYQKGVPILIVGDGRVLRMIDYQIRQVTPWPIGNSPLSVLVNPDRSLRGVATVVTNNPRVLVIRARDRKGAEFGTTTLTFAKVASAPSGLMLLGWTAQDVQNNRTTIRLANQRFNIAVPDSAFRWTDPRPAKAARPKS